MSGSSPIPHPTSVLQYDAQLSADEFRSGARPLNLVSAFSTLQESN